MPEAWLHQVCPFPSTTSLLYKPTKYLHKKYFILNYFVAKKHPPPPHPPQKKSPLVTFKMSGRHWAHLLATANQQSQS